MLNKSLEIKLISPKNEKEFQDYFYFRWFILRSKFSENVESAKDDIEYKSYHIMALYKNTIIGVGRVHSIDSLTSQIRYMAVDKNNRLEGIGSKILKKLVKKSKSEGKKKIILHSRENAVNFYKKNGFSLIKKSHTIFNSIQHYLMEKPI